MASLPRPTPAPANTGGAGPAARTTRRVSVDGLELAVHGWPGEGPPLLLLHGGMAHSGWWERLAPELGAACRPFAFDRRGHGDSDWTEPLRYGWARDVADIEAVLREVEPGPWILAGHSQGGLLAAEVATAGRASLAGLVLVDIPLDPQSPELRRTGRALRRMPQLHYRTLADAVRRFQPYPPGHCIDESELVRLAESSFRATEDGRYTSRFHWQRFQSEEDSERHPLEGFGERLSRIALPTLILRGAESTILSREHHAEMVRRIPGSIGVEIADSTHNLHVERAAEVGEAMRRFLARLSRAERST
jgi:pimeloyl-ACP methyl ester carboxylesterase